VTTEPSPVAASPEVELLAINTIRALAMDAVEQAQSGHAGAPMALAPLGYRLFTRYLKHDPSDPLWPDRDRFVLSAGHASMLLYSLLHLSGYDLDLEDLQEFRQLDSRTPGHPEYGETPGVETTTGPLGQGFGNAVGMALAERMMAARYNTGDHEVVDHRTWVFASDGDVMEGVQSEAASLAGHLGLDRLIVCYDDNHVTIDGQTDLAFSEDVEARYRAYGWRTLTLPDPNDLDMVDKVFTEALASDGRPTLIRVTSVIGYGAPTIAGTSAAHSDPLGPEEIAGAKEALGWPYTEPFTIPDEVRDIFDQRERGATAHEEWDQRFASYRDAESQLAEQFDRVHRGELPDGWDAELPTFADGEKEATRASSGTVINALAEVLPELVGGSADLAASNKTTIKGGGDVAAGSYGGRNLHFGVREHAMVAMLSGMTLHGGLRVFGASFLTFTDYARPSIRLAALMGLPVVYVMTHDSVGLGEDGPTHQPIEHVASLRAIPNLTVIRPGDARETLGAWREAIARTDGPTVLALTRQGVPPVDGTDPARVRDGAYVIDDEEDDEPDVVLLATGSELHVAVEARDLLAEDDIIARVVSMPSWEHFEDTDDAYQDEVLPPDIPVLSIEAGTTFGWGRWADDHVGIDHFGQSAPGASLLEHFGFTASVVADAAASLLEDDDE
jgi:transketolase